jgi:adenine deaminase
MSARARDRAPKRGHGPDLTVARRRRLIAVARGAAPADLYVRAGTVLNVYTGEVERADVAVAGERIAYVGGARSPRDHMIGPRTRIFDAAGRVLVPGYIDPHVHPGNLITPSSFARYVLPLGTTAVFADNLQMWELGGPTGFQRIADALARWPIHFYWMLRVHGQARTTDEPRRFPLAALARAIAHPSVAAIGEVTRWPELHAGDPELLRRLELARRRGLRVEGHTAGAAPEKVPALAAAGLTSDHEPITAEEALSRARQGIAVMLRDSSLRPDLGALLDALKRAPALGARVMLTADGAMPAFVRAHGFVDHLIRVALDGGVAPVDAYRMATLNAATYYGRDADLGGIAPGRSADLCVLGDLSEPRPETVIARGRVVAERGKLVTEIAEPPWRRIFTSPRARLDVRWRCVAGDLALPSRDRYPVIRLVSAVISRLEERAPVAGDLHAALIDREGRWVAPGVLAGFAERLDGLAATTTTDFNIVALGRDREAMAQAVNRLLELHGGIVLVERGQVALEIPLPIGGIMTPRPLDEAADLEERLRGHLVDRGHAFHDPLFTLFFLAADFLPAVRLSPRGVWDVKRGRVLLPSRRRVRPT